MQTHTPTARQLATNGFRYVGEWDGLHHYQKCIPKSYEPIDRTRSRIIPQRYCLVSVTDEDIADGNAIDMMHLEVTRVRQEG